MMKLDYDSILDETDLQALFGDWWRATLADLRLRPVETDKGPMLPASSLRSAMEYHCEWHLHECIRNGTAPDVIGRDVPHAEAPQPALMVNEPYVHGIQLPNRTSAPLKSLMTGPRDVEMPEEWHKGETPIAEDIPPAPVPPPEPKPNRFEDF